MTESLEKRSERLKHKMMKMPANLPVQMEISAPSRAKGLPLVKPKESVKIVLTRSFTGQTGEYANGVIFVRDPFGTNIARIPFKFGEFTKGTFTVQIKEELLSGIYTAAVAFEGEKDLTSARGGSGEALFGCFRVEKGLPPIISHKVTYKAKITNEGGRQDDYGKGTSGGIDLFDVSVFLATPISIPFRQEVIKLRPNPSTGAESNDLVGNNWVRYSLKHLAFGKSFTCGYTALVRNHSVRYALPPVSNAAIPHEIRDYTKPEKHIESDHRRIKEMANQLAKTYRNHSSFVAAAMRTVFRTLKYKPQRSELGAAYAIANKIGDCTEYAALTAALCRANGIPARLQAGFGFGGATWERHAWAEVWLQGFWVPVDSTWYGRDGTLGITSRHIPLIVGNWMSSRIRQEFNIRWKTKGGRASPPTLDAKWKVERLSSTRAAPGPRLRPSPIRLRVKAPDAVPRGTLLKLGIKISPVPKVSAALTMMAISATISDSEMDRIVALKPIPISISKPMDTTMELQMPRCIPKAKLSLRVWLDGKPTEATWEKAIGLIQ